MPAPIGTKSPTADAYPWIGTSSGPWDAPGNWRDTAPGAVQGLHVPGALTPATIGGSPSVDDVAVAGGGSAASLHLTGGVVPAGHYAVGDLVLDTYPDLPLRFDNSVPLRLSLGAGCTVSAAAVTAARASIAIAGAGAGLAASGPVTLGGPRDLGWTIDATSGALAVRAGGYLTASAMTVAAGAFSVSGAGSTAALGGGLTLGAPKQPGYAASTGRLSVDAGASLAVGAVSLLYGSSASVKGSGSRLASSGQLTLSNAGANDDAGAPGLAVRDGGFVQAAGLDAQLVPGGSVFRGSIAVDAASALEIGSAGNAAAGAITVDAGNAMSMAGAYTLRGDVVDNGTLSETGGALTVNGNLSGSGQVRIGEDATLALNGTAAAATTIAFTGAGAALFIGPSAAGANPVEATLAGFQPGDRIILATPANTAAYAASPDGSPGTLTLRDGAATVGTLRLVGDYAGGSFLLAPTMSGGASISLVQEQAGAGTASPTADAFLWVGPGGGLWGAAGNWADAAAGANPAPHVPGTLTPVLIAGPADGTVEAIAGGGSAASVGLTGAARLRGDYAVGGELAVGGLAAATAQPGATATLTAGLLAVDAGSTVAAGSVDVRDGALSLAGGASVLSTGPVTVGSPPADEGLVPTYGASGTIDLAPGAALTALGGMSVEAGTLNDAGGTARIGGALTLGTASEAGTVNLSAGATLSTAGGAFVDFGALNDAGSTLRVGGALTLGTAETPGEVSITSGGVLSVAGAVTGATSAIAVNGAGSRLIAGGTLTVTGGKSAPYDDLGTAHNSFGYIDARNGGFVQAGGLVLGAAPPLTTDVSPNLSVDAASAIEIGTAGGAAAGAITVDAGRAVTVNSTASLDGALVNNGTVAVNGGTLTLNGDLSGSGAVQIGKGATLDLNGNAAAAGTIAFGGAGATLSIDARYGIDGATHAAALRGIDATLAGFQAGNRIALRVPVSTATYAAGSGGSPGTLTLRDGTVTVGTLRLAGGYAGKSFVAGDVTRDGATISLVNRPPAKPASDPLFDSTFYLTRNPDVAAAGADPYKHYLSHGWKEGRNPSALFSTRYYLAHNPDVAAARVNPLLHFEMHGHKEGRNPSAGFDTRDYRAANPDVKAAGVNPLLHYVQYGRAEGRAAFKVAGPPNPLVDAAYYYARNPDVKAAGLDATAHYLRSGWREGRNPDAFFDTSYYLVRNPDVEAAGADPLLHFENYGYKEGRNPSLLFSTSKYLAANPEVKAAGLNPLAHYLGKGWAEGRMAFLTGQTAAADPLVDAAFYDKQLGATLIPTGPAAQRQAAWSYDASGWQKGLNPGAFFDTAYYLGHNPDVAAARINPLTHYEQHGWREDRDPSARFSTRKYLAAYGDVERAGVDPLLHFVVNGQAEGRAAFSV